MFILSQLELRAALLQEKFQVINSFRDSEKLLFLSTFPQLSWEHDIW